MCGIAGFIGFANNCELAKMANKIQIHRGPDHQGVWNDEFISIAHQRLSIIDLSPRSNQPFVDNQYIIAFNGEIYNYKEIRNVLENQRNVVFKTESDTEVVLEAYKAYGVGCLDHFIGMFAFVVYNRLDKTTFLARDHFGIKPLFYASKDGFFSFSSELKTLASIDIFNKEINYSALISSLNYIWVSGNETMFKGIYKLPPGHYMRLEKDLSFVINKYYQIPEGEIIDNELKAIELLDKTFNESISRHMVADVPVCGFLSGGLDSSLICALAAKHTNKLSTYTIATGSKDKKIEQMPDDERYAKKLASEFNFDHNEIIIGADIVKLLPSMVRTLDEPIGDPAAINTFLICNEAHRQGAKVLLSGMGADELFFGYRRQKATLMAMRYRKYAPFLFRYLTNKLVNRLPVRFNGRGLRLVRWAKKFLSFTELPLSRSYMQSYSYYNKQELQQLFTNHHQSTIDQLYYDHDALFYSKFQNDPVNQMCYTDINMFMVGLNLTYSDRASMAASVEVRVPFIDKEIVTLAMKLSGSLKYFKGESKYLLKRVAEKYLPAEIIYRPKASFGAPIRSWISGELKGMVDDLLSEDNVKNRGIFNSSYVNKLIDEDRRGLVDNAYRIYQLLTIELWFREFVDEKIN